VSHENGKVLSACRRERAHGPRRAEPIWQLARDLYAYHSRAREPHPPQSAGGGARSL